MLLKRICLLALLLSGAAYADVIKTVQIGATDQTVTMKVIDSATGVPSTDLAFNSSGIDLQYWRHGANSAVAITEATQTVNGAHSDGGFVHIGAGQYRLDLPDAAVASGATAVEVYGVITGEIVIGGTVQLVAYNPHDAVRLGLTALPNANADAAGGLPISDAGGLDLDAHAALLVTVEGQTDDIGAAGAGLTVLSTQSSVNTLDTLIDALTAALGVSLQAGSNGAFPAMGIVASGTAQAYTAGTPSVTLASSTAMGDDDLNGTTILVLGSNEGDWQAASISDFVGSTDVATIDAAFSTAPTGTISYIIFGTSAGSGLTAQNVWEYATRALTVLDEDSTTIDLNATAVGAAASVTGAVGSVTGSVGSVTGAVGSVTGAVGSVTGNVGGNVTGTVGGIAGTITTLDALDTAQDTQHGTTQTAIDAVPTTAEVASEIADALATDTYAEPGAGTPASTTTLAAKINYLYKAWRNLSTQTADTYTLYNDDATTAAQEAPVSDNGTAFSKGEMVAP